ncbi:putative toxin-antitoxin system toxin component, PIN family [Persicitalea sp.]|uniref:putative toxin-antitoxin system toxin component, PIN family n=1 Tax=Persicitalea sp. TaxID=3100273 RepID=UPI00359434EB
MRIVIDTNLYVSAIINENSRRRLNEVLLNPALSILLDTALLNELNEVIHLPKFSRYVSPLQIEQFMNLLFERATIAETTSIVRASPDPKDDYLLALCRDSQADYLLTGHKLDLLALGQFEKTRIVTLSQFLALFPQ